MLRGRQLEFIPALFLILWGAWVLFPTSDSLKGTPFIAMLKLAPEWAWGLFYFTVGVLQMVLIFTAKKKLRLYTSFISIWIILSLAIFSAIGNISTVASVTYFSIAVCEWLGYTEILAEIYGKNGPCS